MKHFRLYLAALMLFTAIVPAIAQRVSVGVKGGLSTFRTTPGNDESKPYIIGPSVEVGLPAGFAVEADALYQRLGSSQAFYGTIGQQTFSYTYRERAKSWEFSLLGKKYFRSQLALLQPYIGTGFSFRTISTHVDTTSSVTSGQDLALTSSASHRTDRLPLNTGVVAAAGLRVNTGLISLLPEFRYTRWGASSETVTRKNAGRFLLGINF